MENDLDAAKLKAALVDNSPELFFKEKELAIMNYAELLTLNPSKIGNEDLDELRSWGINDGEILEINQVVSYFCYANRTALGLGVNTKNERIGLSPNDEDDSNNWSHK